MELPEGFREPDDDVPIWGDDGPVTVLIDGKEHKGYLFIDAITDADPEIPVPILRLADGTEYIFSNVQGWRRDD